MKKLLILAFALVALVAPAATVVPFSPVEEGEFKVSQGGKLVRVEAFSPVSGGTLSLSTVYSANVFTNAVRVLGFTNILYTVVHSNDYTHVVTTNDYTTLSFVDDPGIVGVSTNATYYATTNSWPVYKETVAVTNGVVSGTLTGYVFTNALDSAVYFAPGERILFSGTALGGFVRLVFE